MEWGRESFGSMLTKERKHWWLNQSLSYTPIRVNFEPVSRKEQLEESMFFTNFDDLLSWTTTLDELTQNAIIQANNPKNISTHIGADKMKEPTIKQRIEQREYNIKDLRDIKIPGDVARFIESSWDQAMKDLYEMLGWDNNWGADNFLKLLLLTWVWTSIELWKGLADVTKVWEDLLKVWSEILNWNEKAMAQVLHLLKALWMEWIRILMILPIGKLLRPLFAKIWELLKKVNLSALEEFLRPLANERGSIILKEWSEIKLVWSIRKLSEKEMLWERLGVNNAFLKFDENMPITDFFKFYKDFKVYFNNKMDTILEWIKKWADINIHLWDLYENFSNILKYCRNWLLEDTTLTTDKAKSIKNTLMKNDEIWEIMDTINDNANFLDTNNVNVSWFNWAILIRIKAIFNSLKKI